MWRGPDGARDQRVVRLEDWLVIPYRGGDFSKADTAELYDGTGAGGGPRTIKPGDKIKTPSGKDYVWNGTRFLSPDQVPDAALNLEKEAIAKIIEKAPVGHIDGRQFWIDEQGDAYVDESGSQNRDPTKAHKVRHAERYNTATRHIFWDKERASFVPQRPLQEKFDSKSPNVFATEAEKNAAVSALTAQMNILLATVSNTPDTRTFRAQLEGKIKEVTKPSEMKALEEHFDNLRPYMNIFRP